MTHLSEKWGCTSWIILLEYWQSIYASTRFIVYKAGSSSSKQKQNGDSYAQFTQPTRTRQDSRSISISCRRCELHWRQVKTVGDRKFRNRTCLVFCSFDLSQNAVWTDFRLFSTISNLQLFSVKYTEDYWKLYWLVANSVHIKAAWKRH